MTRSGLPGLFKALPELYNFLPGLDQSLPGLDHVLPGLDEAIPELDQARTRIIRSCPTRIISGPGLYQTEAIKAQLKNSVRNHICFPQHQRS